MARESVRIRFRRRNNTKRRNHRRVRAASGYLLFLWISQTSPRPLLREGATLTNLSGARRHNGCTRRVSKAGFLEARRAEKRQDVQMA